MLLLAAALLLRAIAAVCAPLVPEEAYYWMYSQHPNLSYFDHPPMIAWMIRAGTAAFGHAEFAVRFLPHLLLCSCSLLMYRLARIWHSRAIALVAAAMLQVLPVYFAMGLIATMDSTLLFFWLACLLALAYALVRGRTIGWYVAGVMLGGAMLTKYTGVFLGAGGALAVLLHRPWRRQLLTPHPWIAALLAIAIFSPVVIWNMDNDWASFRFQFVDRFAHHGFDWGDPLNFALFQLLVLTPFLLAAAIRLIARPFVPRPRRRAISGKAAFAVAFSAPMLLLMAYKSLRSEIHINWTAPLYLSLMPELAATIVAAARLRRRSRRAVAWFDAMRYTALICLLLSCGFLLYLLLVQPRTKWISAFGPWRPLAECVEEYEDKLEQTAHREPLVIADGRYRLASILAFYRTPIDPGEQASRYTTSQWVLRGQGLGFAFWSDRRDWIGRDCLFITDDDDEDIEAVIGPWFERVEIVHDPRLNNGKQHYLAICFGLREQAKGSE